ncbi:ribbon-helix-helix domain-containing protein [Tautonia marina]|uniref:ribbon-helix-helix domain-containing protein n=1 Tax=Tautonia marina TaxID=2653855 RepID=UPI001260D366|nr:type II toxin-antitoxin system ParD family antitoxin [Tautonia marina]
MATMTISLPDEDKAFLEQEAARRGFTSVAAYMGALIREDRKRQETRRRVDDLLLEGLDSGPATPMTRHDWDAIRHEVHRRDAERRG